MNHTILIYSLTDPTDGKVFYVGRTKMALVRRLRGHLKDSRHGKNPKAKKIAQMLKDGIKPIIAEIARVENASLEEAEKTEQAWIDYLSIANTLLNSKPASAGGIGNGNGIRYSWTAEILEKLGTKSDVDIARETDINTNAVMDKRQSLGIPKFNELKWTPEVLSRLGKESDGAIAKSLGCTDMVVGIRRRKLGIPALPRSQYQKRKKSQNIQKTKPTKVPKKRIAPNRVDVPQWVTEKLGTMTDAELTKLSGIPHRIIWTRRKELGIPSYSEKNNHPTRYGYKPGVEPAPQIPLSDSIIQQLGKIPDYQLARESGIHESKIWRERTKRGIPTCPRPENCYSNLPSSIVEKLGKVQDAVLAKEAGVSKDSIKRLRYSLGVPSWRSTTEHPTSRKNKA
jgi:hypothetical protein